MTQNSIYAGCQLQESCNENVRNLCKYRTKTTNIIRWTLHWRFVRIAKRFIPSLYERENLRSRNNIKLYFIVCHDSCIWLVFIFHVLVLKPDPRIVLMLFTLTMRAKYECVFQQKPIHSERIEFFFIYFIALEILICHFI